LIETEKQRRWWFATHPEFSHKVTGTRGSEEDEDSEKLRPEDVDAYVDEAFKYQRDTTIIALLKEAKFWFGTEFESKTPAEQHALLWGDEASAGRDQETAREVEMTYRQFPPNVKVNIKPDDPFCQKYVDWYNSLPIKPKGGNLKIDFVPTNELGNRQGIAVPGTDRVAVFDNASVEWEWKFDSHRLTDKIIDAAEWIKRKLWRR
jgi:hypothetical protein